MCKKFAPAIAAAVIGLSFAPMAHAQTKYSVRVYNLSGSAIGSAETDSITVQAEDADGNLLNITPYGGTATPAYTVGTGGQFNNFTIQASPTGAKIVTLFFTRSRTPADGSTTVGTNMITYAAAVPSNIQTGTAVVGPGIPAGTTVASVSADSRVITLTNNVTTGANGVATYFGTGFTGTNVPSLLLVSARSQSLFITLGP